MFNLDTNSTRIFTGPVVQIRPMNDFNSTADPKPQKVDEATGLPIWSLEGNVFSDFGQHDSLNENIALKKILVLSAAKPEILPRTEYKVDGQIQFKVSPNGEYAVRWAITLLGDLVPVQFEAPKPAISAPKINKPAA